MRCHWLGFEFRARRCGLSGHAVRDAHRGRHSNVICVRCYLGRGSTRFRLTPGPGHRRMLRCDGRRSGCSGPWRFRCRRCLAARRRRGRDRVRSLRLTCVCSSVSRAFRWGPRPFVCSVFANAPQIRSQRRHRDRHATFREHRGDGRPAVALRAEGKDLGRERANRLLLAQFGRLVQRNLVERLLQLQNRLGRELVLVVHRFSCSRALPVAGVLSAGDARQTLESTPSRTIARRVPRIALLAAASSRPQYAHADAG
jgi:hypothetical protein